MRLFLSYRRDDTAGRAGRLFDGLTQRLGPGQVFQDVEAIKPGLDFERAVADSLESADASVVVIGPEWATITEPGGARRLDRDDDFVRLEVGVALRSERPVVPVLVGGAQMPRAEELPEELRPLLKRQAFTVRDSAWNGDVDDLVRDLRSQLPEPPRRRRRPLVVGAAVALLVVAAGALAAVLLWPDPDDPGGGAATTAATDGPEATAAPGVVPPCTVVDRDSLTALEIAPPTPAVLTLADGSGRLVAYTGIRVAAQERQEGWRVLADVEVVNETTAPAPGMETWFVTATDFRGVAIDGVVGEPGADCFNVVTGSQQVAQGATTIVQVGFDTPDDPRNSELILLTRGPPVPLSG